MTPSSPRALTAASPSQPQEPASVTRRWPRQNALSRHFCVCHVHSCSMAMRTPAWVTRFTAHKLWRAHAPDGRASRTRARSSSARTNAAPRPACDARLVDALFTQPRLQSTSLEGEHGTGVAPERRGCAATRWPPPSLPSPPARPRRRTARVLWRALQWCARAGHPPVPLQAFWKAAIAAHRTLAPAASGSTEPERINSNSPRSSRDRATG